MCSRPGPGREVLQVSATDRPGDQRAASPPLRAAHSLREREREGEGEGEGQGEGEMQEGESYLIEANP